MAQSESLILLKEAETSALALLRGAREGMSAAHGWILSLYRAFTLLHLSPFSSYRT